MTTTPQQDIYQSFHQDLSERRQKALVDAYDLHVAQLLAIPTLERFDVLYHTMIDGVSTFLQRLGFDGDDYAQAYTYAVNRLVSVRQDFLDSDIEFLQECDQVFDYSALPPQKTGDLCPVPVCQSPGVVGTGTPFFNLGSDEVYLL